ncbi:MAG: multidrug effflux MFS transporter [Hyphomicrobiaceae bacterium]
MSTSQSQPAHPSTRALPIPYKELIVLIALLMSMTAMSIDIMLPSLPQIAATYGVSSQNDQQLVVVTYMAGFAFGQLFWGPVSDRLGRRWPLLGGLSIFVVACILATLAPSFEMLLAARLLQGFGGGAPRTIATAIIRDLFSGREMARVMSTAMMVFITVPIFAPTVGQAVASVGSWPAAFYVLIFAGVTASIWSAFRLPETGRQHGEAPFGLGAALHLVLTSRITIGYGLATCFMFGCLVTYISSAQQIFVEVFDLGRAFPIAFGAVACALALASFTNARLVQQAGMRRLSHAALVTFLGIAGLLALVTGLSRPSLWVAGPLMGLCFYLFGLTQANFNAIAMQPVGRAAGTASALLGFATTGIGAMLGGFVARQFDGSVFPLALGFAVMSACALMCVLIVEGWRGMFRGE